ncbi:unnamed protein product [Musa acuminata subsp. malaccensis]|uniref:(wild Malaysian banana) hypothetical protein n=1 Tax=Musa acuminata subsp. malaccensis TaxID=214687 RepID=A0A804IBY9_MUSAM|nr:PREDICTED: uncharacterized protein LOC103973382 [Musa acuminata subsp. malaccensis]CAG1850134.1 unnamed protein product [Musa acuminata subsp. malaccensis]
MMMRRVAASLVPPWLEPLLSTHFFAACPLHPDAPRSESNMFCLDCGASASSFCFYCRSDRHSGHRVIQIRRSSYHDVVRVAEIQKVLDISGVQTYVINSARVLFLNERPQPRGTGRGGASGSSAAGPPSSSSPHTCEICARSLLDPFRFCSLGCKLAGIKRNGDATFVLHPGDEDASGGGESSSTAAAEESKGGRRGRWGGVSCEEVGHDARDPARPPPPPNSRRRKGIPHRAPFAS